MKKVIISVTNDLSTDQRVDKVASSLLRSGFAVLLVGRCLRNSKNITKRNYSTHRFKMFFHRGVMFYLEYNLRLFLFLLFHKSDFLLSNDLDTLLANFIVSKIKNIRLIYDSHELFTDLPELQGRPIRKFIWSCLESFCLRRINFSYTVSNSIANYYRVKYGVQMSVICNFPITQNFQNVTTNNKKNIIIYQGAVNKDRGIELMIEAMRYVDAQLYVVGDGDLLCEMQEYTAKLKLKKKVFFKGKVDFENLFEITKNANLGLSFEDDTCLSYRYSLPNKIFDYINAEIPVLLSNLPEFRGVIDSYNVGQILDSRDALSVARQINTLLATPKKDWHNELSAAKKAYSWISQEQKLLSFFK